MLFKLDVYTFIQIYKNDNKVQIYKASFAYGAGATTGVGVGCCSGLRISLEVERGAETGAAGLGSAVALTTAGVVGVIVVTGAPAGTLFVAAAVVVAAPAPVTADTAWGTVMMLVIVQQALWKHISNWIRKNNTIKKCKTYHEKAPKAIAALKTLQYDVALLEK